jgi:predicted component of type VI protein secretion system
MRNIFEAARMGNLHILNGPDIGRCLELKEGANYIGRSPQNDIQIKDTTVSRRHLRILKKSEMYFLTDLESQNGTFVDGKCLTPGMEVEVRKDVPIAIGMTIIGIGDEACMQMRPFLDSVGLTKETGNNSGIFCVHKERTNQRKLELVYKVTDLLRQNLSKKDTLEILLGTFLELLGRTDRATFVLVEQGTGRIVQSISKSKGNTDSSAAGFSEKIVARVLDEMKPLIINDARKEERESELASTLKMENITSVMCIPMMSFSELVGVIYVDSLNKPYPFAQEDITLFQDIANRTAAFVLFEGLTEG